MNRGQVFCPGLAIRVKVGFLANSNSPMTESLSQAFVVECGRVENAAVIPDRYQGVN
jgi:hypothetical protein